MSTDLPSGGNISITKLAPLTTNVSIEFSWSMSSNATPTTEIVHAAIMLDEHGKAISDRHMVFFNQLRSPEQSVSAVENEKRINVNLATVPPEVKSINFVAFVNPEVRKEGTFYLVTSAQVCISDGSGQELACYRPERFNSDLNAMLFCELYRYNDQWKFRALGQGYTGGLNEVCKSVGIAL